MRISEGASTRDYSAQPANKAGSMAAEAAGAGKDAAKPLDVIESIAQAVDGKNSVALIGHVNPDGDCIGSCIGLYNYLADNFPGIRATVFLEPLSDKFGYLKGFGDVVNEYDAEMHFDLCVTLDASDEGRLGRFAPYLKDAGDSLCVDHHVTNAGMARVNIIDAEASSTCEVLFGLLEADRISLATAECLYTGIIHDTGVFKYSNTSRRTMEIAGLLMEKGLDFTTIIDKSFFEKSYRQARLHGKGMESCKLLLGGSFIYTVITRGDFERFDNAPVSATDGLVDQMRNVRGVKVAALLYELEKPRETGSSRGTENSSGAGNIREYKVSLRSNCDIDVSAIAAAFGGGGHVKAAGFNFCGDARDIIAKICDMLPRELVYPDGGGADVRRGDKLI